jgi:hypothetical protein
VPQENDEATPIARLIGQDGKSVVGLAYVWETSELAILWFEPKKPAMFIHPKIDPEVLADAKTTTPDDVILLLGRLPKVKTENGSS